VDFGAKIREFQKTRLFRKGGKNVRILFEEKNKKRKTKMTTLVSYAPERFLAGGLSRLLRWGAIIGSDATKGYPRRGTGVVGYLSVRVAGIVGLRVVNSERPRDRVWLKALRVVATIGCLVVVSGSKAHQGEYTYEYPLVRLTARLGRRLLVTAEDLRVFYLALELQSLSLYILAASARGSAYSTEAGLKYLRLGAFASGLYLLGSSLIYGSLGTTDYGVIGGLLSSPIDSERGGDRVRAGFALVRIAIRFKLAVAPFHRWSPDVYEGSPTTSTRFFAAVTKIAALGGLIRRTYGPFAGLWRTRVPGVVVRSALSRTIAILGALGQRRRKRFLAYSAIGHRGYRRRGLATGSVEGVEATRRYLFVYVVGSLGVWAAVESSGRVYLTDLGSLSRRAPALARVVAIGRFSRAGVPPRAGFLAKLRVFFSARESGLWRLAAYAVRTSVVGAFYYLRIVKILYFEGVAKRGDARTTSLGRSTGSAWVRAVSTYVTVFLLVNPSLVSVRCSRAVAARL
jgi:NADH-quinone oxidoreductase subunit N